MGRGTLPGGGDVLLVGGDSQGHLGRVDARYIFRLKISFYPVIYGSVGILSRVVVGSGIIVKEQLNGTATTGDINGRIFFVYSSLPNVVVWISFYMWKGGGGCDYFPWSMFMTVSSMFSL